MDLDRTVPDFGRLRRSMMTKRFDQGFMMGTSDEGGRALGMASFLSCLCCVTHFGMFVGFPVR